VPLPQENPGQPARSAEYWVLTARSRIVSDVSVDCRVTLKLSAGTENAGQYAETKKQWKYCTLSTLSRAVLNSSAEMP